MKVGRLVRALAVAAVLAITGLALPQPAVAAGDYLDVRITEVSTPVLDLSDPEQIVELSGTLTNVSTEPIRYLNVHFWRLDQPITTPSRLDAYTADVPLGARLTSEADGNLDILTRDEEFVPGQQAQFSVRASVGQLTQGSYPLTRDDAAYLLGVQVRGIPGVGGNQVVGEDQAVVVATGEPTESSAVVELAAPVSWLPDGTFVDDSLASELTGRLGSLLSSAERDGVVATVDPALLEAVDRLTGEHVVGGEERPGSGIAIGWLERIRTLAGEGRLWRLPYGDPNLVRARDAGALDSTWEASLAATPGEWLGLPLVVVVGAGADESLASTLDGASMIIVRGADGAAPGILGAARTSAVTDLPAGVRAGRLLAEELVAPRPPLYLISSPHDDSLDRVAEQSRARIAPSDEPAEPLTWPRPMAEDPWTAVTGSLDEARATLEFRGELMGTDETTGLTYLRAMAFSSGFADEAEATAYVEANTPAEIDTTLVELSAAQSFVMGSRTNMFPATITNGLDFPVQVKIRFDSDAPQRISVPDVGPVTVQPGESATVDIVPEAAANGVTIVHARLATLEDTPLGDQVEIEITATDFGRVGWIIIVASGAVVVGGSALRIRAVQRERAAGGEE